MQEERKELVVRGLETAFVDRNISSNLQYKPQFISNDRDKGSKVLAFIEKDLSTCEKFYISVAFITMGGITPLLQTLRELEKRGIEGCILTTNYLNFSEPKAIRMLSKFKNIKIRMFMTSEAKTGFHTKGYIFKQKEIYHIIGTGKTYASAFALQKECPNRALFLVHREQIAKQAMISYKKVFGDKKTFALQK